MTWAISAAIGGVAGVLIAPIIYLDPNLGFIGVKAFAGAILGGFGSIPGAIVGGMLLGILENLSGYFFNAGIKQVSTYILLDPGPRRAAERPVRRRPHEEGLRMGPAQLRRLQRPFLAAVVVGLLALPNMADNYIIYVTARLFIYVLVALGLNLLTGYTGQVSLGHAAFFAIGAYTAGVLAESARWPSVLCVTWPPPSSRPSSVTCWGCRACA